MTHIFLFLVCILSIEIFIKLNFLSTLDRFSKIIKRVVRVVASRNISDHWKEKILPIYALRIMKYSLHILVVLSFIISLFITADYFNNDLLLHIFSFIGIIESLVFSSGYLFLRKSLVK
jgi:hypothetical protein